MQGEKNTGKAGTGGRPLMLVPRNTTIFAFALIVDVNDYSAMVSSEQALLVAQFTRDVLSGGIAAVEDCGGSVMGFMGDAFLALLPDAQSTFLACAGIAKDLDNQCEYISTSQERDSEAWPFAAGGPSLKIAFESGWIETSEISSRELGTQTLLAGQAINYANRISAAGGGNRCLCGPSSAEQLRLVGYEKILDGPHSFQGKKDMLFDFFELDLGEFWRSGPRNEGDESFWG